MVDAGIVTSKSGKVRLLEPDELPKDRDPASDSRLKKRASDAQPCNAFVQSWPEIVRLAQAGPAVAQQGELI